MMAITTSSSTSVKPAALLSLDGSRVGWALPTFCPVHSRARRLGSLAGSAHPTAIARVVAS